MTEHTNDPCKKQEIPERPDPYAPDVNPVSPQTLVIPTAVFPSRQTTAIETETVRDSVLLEANLFLTDSDLEVVQLDQFDFRALRYPGDINLFPTWREYPGFPDPFRYATGKFWQFKNKNLIFLNDQINENRLESLFFAFRNISSTLEGDLEKTQINLNLNVREFGNLKYRDAPQPTELFLIQEMYNFVEGQTPLVQETGFSHYDFCFKAPAAFFSSEAEQSNVPLVETVSFEPVVGNLPLTQDPRKEEDLPNLYRIYNSINSPGENIPTTLVGDKVQKFAGPAVEEMASISEQATNQLLGSSLFTAASQTLNSHIRIRFNTNHESEFSAHLLESGLSEFFLDYLSAKPSVGTENRHVQILDQSVLGGRANNRLEYRYEPRTHRLEGFTSAAYEDLSITRQNLNNFQKEHPIGFSVSARSLRIEQSSELGDFERLMQSFKRSNQRSYIDILSGVTCKTEVVAYRIEKLNTDLEVLQEFYFFNHPDVSEIDFLDTQVIYNRNYNYRIYAINIVVGNEYTYRRQKQTYEEFLESAAGTFEDPQFPYDFDVENKSVIHFIETPYFENQVFMIDKPPIFPQVEIIPFFQDAQRVAVRLTPTYGSVTEDPIMILEQDEAQIERMRSALGPNETMITYTSDSQPTAYEALVLEEEPFSYSDFARAQRFTVEATYNSGYIEFNLESNKRYYMIFRASDSSGISNPSAVYTLVLNSHADGVYIQFDEHEMVRPELDEQITFERILKIDPSPEQLSMEFHNLVQEPSFFETAPSVNSVSLGTIEESVWTKNYKFRLISRTSGKAIDLNVFYEYNVIPPDSEFDAQSFINFSLTESDTQGQRPELLESSQNLVTVEQGPLPINVVNNPEPGIEYDENGIPRSTTRTRPETVRERLEREERERTERARQERMQNEAERAAQMGSIIRTGYNYQN